jgi:replicative DNA helicase
MSLELARCMLCSQGRIDAGKFRSGFVSAEDRKRLVEASAKLSKAPMFIDDARPHRHRNRRLAAAEVRSSLGLVVIDYLH